MKEGYDERLNAKWVKRGFFRNICNCYTIVIKCSQDGGRRVEGWREKWSTKVGLVG